MNTAQNVSLAESKRPEVFGYHDYRAFLRDWLDFLKNTRDGFSIRSLSRQAGVANGYLPMVLNGSRNLSSRAWIKLLPHLGLSSTEKSYLQTLHQMAEADSTAIRIEAFDKIQRFRAYRTKNPKETETYRYLNRWFYVAVRELAALPGFSADPAWIQQRLKTHVPLNEIKSALDFLFANGYIERTDNGRIKLASKQIDCVGGVFKIALGKFHREMLELASLSLENTKSQERSVVGHTLAIPAAQYGEVKAILDEALKKIEELSFPQSELDSVYHMMLVAFPLTQPEERRKREDDTEVK